MSSPVGNPRNQKLPAAYGIVVLVISLLVSVIVSVGYSNHRNNVQDKRWCELLITLDQPLPPNVPADQRERSQKILDQIGELRVELGCGR